MTRRQLLAGAAVAAAGGAAAVQVAGQNGFLPPDSLGLYGCGHALTYATHRLLTRNANAREFARSEISPIPHPKGDPPKGDDFLKLKAGGFQDWRLKVDGLVSRQVSLSIADLKSKPSRSQITQLVCEEGWSYVAEWTGVPLADVLKEAGISPKARYVVYYAMDGWFDAIDLDDANHPQTLISYGMNGGDMSIGHGGPLRMRIPKQLGYKNVKFLNRVSAVESLKGVDGLLGSYSWYAGM